MLAASVRPVCMSCALVASVRLICSVLPAACATDNKRLPASLAESVLRVPLVSSRHLMIRSPVYCGCGVAAAATWLPIAEARQTRPAPAHSQDFNRKREGVISACSVVSRWNEKRRQDVIVDRPLHKTKGSMRLARL